MVASSLFPCSEREIRCISGKEPQLQSQLNFSWLLWSFMPFGVAQMTGAFLIFKNPPGCLFDGPHLHLYFFETLYSNNSCYCKCTRSLESTPDLFSAYFANNVGTCLTAPWNCFSVNCSIFLCSENGLLCVKMFVIPKQKKIIVRSIERQNCVIVQKFMDLTAVHVWQKIRKRRINLPTRQCYPSKSLTG